MRGSVYRCISCLLLSACGGGTGILPLCTLAGASDAPGVAQTTATEVWRWPTAASTPLQAVVDDTAVYWYEDSGAVWRWVKGEAIAEELRPAPQSRVWIRGLVADGEELYWAEADLLEDGFQPATALPSRLMRLDKASLAIDVFAEVQEFEVVAEGIDASSVYVQREWFGGPSVRIARDSGEISEAPDIPEGSRIFGDRFYWITPGSDEHPGELFRGFLSDPTLRSLGPIENSELHVGPGTVLWHRDRYVEGPPQVLYQNFVIVDEERGCTAQMPAAGESISFATAVDESHVYWHSYNKLGNVIAYADGRPSPELPDLPFFRMRLDSGRIERIETSGFSWPNLSSIIGQDAEHIYVETPTALISIDKP